MLSSSYPMERYDQMAYLLVGSDNTMVVGDDYISRKKLHQHSAACGRNLTYFCDLCVFYSVDILSNYIIKRITIKTIIFAQDDFYKSKSFYHFSR